MYNLPYYYDLLYKQANSFIKYTPHINKNVCKMHICVADVKGLKKQLIINFNDDNNITLYSAIIQYREDGYVNYTAIPNSHHDDTDKIIKSDKVTTLSCIVDYLESINKLLGFNIRVLAPTECDLLNFILNNRQYIELIIKRTVSRITKEIDSQSTSEIKSIKKYAGIQE